MQGVEPTEAPSSVAGLYALLGCATWQNVEDRGCSTRNSAVRPFLVRSIRGKVRTHVMPDSWWGLFPSVVNAITERYKAREVLQMGNMTALDTEEVRSASFDRVDFSGFCAKHVGSMWHQVAASYIRLMLH